MVKVELKNMFNLLIIMRDKSYINYVTVSEAMFFRVKLCTYKYKLSYIHVLSLIFSESLY